MALSPSHVLDKLTQPLFLVRAAALFSAACLSFALYTQYFQGLAPCELCIWQRWPYGIIAALGVVSLAVPRLALPLLFAVALLFLTNAGIALFHTGVEQKWWAGLEGCSPKLDFNVSLDQMLAQLEAEPVTRCDAIAWTFLGLSMAAWNVVICLFAAIFCLVSGLRAHSCALKRD